MAVKSLRSVSAFEGYEKVKKNMQRRGMKEMQ
jgi:hypothetical protein